MFRKKFELTDVILKDLKICIYRFYTFERRLEV